MKHTKKYLDAMWVIENPDKYDERNVLDAKRYTNAYLEGYTQALLITPVVGRSEQLCPQCNSADLFDIDDHYTKCQDCGFSFVGA